MSKERVLTEFLEKEMNFLNELSKSYMYMAEQDTRRYEHFMKLSRDYNNMYLESFKMIQQQENALKQKENPFDIFNR